VVVERHKVRRPERELLERRVADGLEDAAVGIEQLQRDLVDVRRIDRRSSLKSGFKEFAAVVRGEWLHALRHSR
jgi:hypothetical protein